jgi:small-conductance mechanosensitive channel
MLDGFLARLPSLALALLVFVFFYGLSRLVARIIRRATTARRHNVGIVFARLTALAVVILGFLIALSVVAPSFRAGDLIKVLGIGSVAIGFAFQNIFQNFLAGLLLLWTEPFRIGDQIRLDAYEGTVEEIETRATTIKTPDGKRVVIPNADLFTHAVTINGAFGRRRWDYELAVPAAEDMEQIKSLILDTIRSSEGVQSDPPPEAALVNLGDPEGKLVKIRISWWTRVQDSAQIAGTLDDVLTAILKALQEKGVDNVSHKAA